SHQWRRPHEANQVVTGKSAVTFRRSGFREVLRRGVQREPDLTELAAHQPRVRRARHAGTYREVGLASRDVVLPHAGQQIDLQLGMLKVELDKDGNKEAVGHRVGRGDADLAGGAAILSGDQPLDAQRGNFHALALLDDGLRGGRRLETIGSSAQQLGAEVLLERRDSPRDRDVVDTERARRAGEGSIAGDREEDADVVPLPLASHRRSSLHTGGGAEKYRDCGADLPCVVTEQKLCERPGWGRSVSLRGKGPSSRLSALFKRLTVVSAVRFYRFEHMVTYRSGKVGGKVEPRRREIAAALLRHRVLARRRTPVEKASRRGTLFLSASEVSGYTAESFG